MYAYKCALIIKIATKRTSSSMEMRKWSIKAEKMMIVITEDCFGYTFTNFALIIDHKAEETFHK